MASTKKTTTKKTAPAKTTPAPKRTRRAPVAIDPRKAAALKAWATRRTNAKAA